MIDPITTRRALLSLAAAAPVGLVLGEVVKLDDFLPEAARATAASGRIVDCTAALTEALATGRRVAIGPGDFGVGSLRLPAGGGLVGEAGTRLHQIAPGNPILDIAATRESGHLADLLVHGLTLVGHGNARSALVRMEARGDFAVWRSHFQFFAKDAFRALEISEGSHVFETVFEIVAEGCRDTAVRSAGVYNRYHLFLTQTDTWALDDRSNGSDIHVVAENAVVIRGQTNRVSACVEGIAAPRAADRAAIIDRGFGNTFNTPVVNMPAKDKGKLQYAFDAFDRSVFVNPQIIGPGVPPDPFAPTVHAFAVIGGRSDAAHGIGTAFDGSAPDRDPRRVSFSGDVRDFTTAPISPGTVRVQRAAPVAGSVVRIDPMTQLLAIESATPLGALTLDFGPLTPPDGWRLEIRTTAGVSKVSWPAGPRQAALPAALRPDHRLDLVFQKASDRWLPLG